MHAYDVKKHQRLRGPAAILFISRDTFSDSIAKCFRACFPGVSHKYRMICCKLGYRTDMSVKKKAPKGGIAPCWGIAGMAEKVSRDRGYRSDSIAVSRDMGPLKSKGGLIRKKCKVEKRSLEVRERDQIMGHQKDMHRRGERDAKSRGEMTVGKGKGRR